LKLLSSPANIDKISASTKFYLLLLKHIAASLRFLATSSVMAFYATSFLMPSNREIDISLIAIFCANYEVLLVAFISKSFKLCSMVP